MGSKVKYFIEQNVLIAVTWIRLNKLRLALFVRVNEEDNLVAEKIVIFKTSCGRQFSKASFLSILEYLQPNPKEKDYMVIKQ